MGGFWNDLPGEALRPGMAAYWDHHARVDLDAYVEVVEAVKAEGLPVVLGLEVDYYQDRMDEVAGLLAGYPFDVLLGSVHWLGTWRFDVLNDPLVMAEWDVRDIDAVWDEYTRAMEELGASGACDVFAHPDLVKVAGRVPAVPDEFYDRITEAAARSGMAAELSSAGWRKPVGEEYPAPPLLKRFVERGVPLTTASDAHSLPDVADRADDLRDLLHGAGVSPAAGLPRPPPPPGPGRSARRRLRMATPAELAFERTNLDDVQLGHLQRLLGTWGVLADLSFSDLILLAPVAPHLRDNPEDATEMVILGQMRPSNSATVVQQDLVGETAGTERWPQAVATFEVGEVNRGELVLDPDDEPVRFHCIPVRCEGTTVAVLVRLSSGAGRRPGHLERTYRDLFERFAVMVAESTFPFPSEEVATEEAPRVGDGVVLVDEEGRVRYASPNATNALHRMGCTPRPRAGVSPTWASRSRPSSGPWPRPCRWWKRWSGGPT